MTYYSTCHKLESQENPNDCTHSKIMKALHYHFSHVIVNLDKCFGEFSDYVISVAEINTWKSVTGHWGSYGDHIRAVEQQPKAPLLCQLDRASWVHSPHRQVTNEVHHVTVHSVPSVWAPTITVIILRSVQAETCSANNKEIGPLGVMPS